MPPCGFSHTKRTSPHSKASRRKAGETRRSHEDRTDLQQRTMFKPGGLFGPKPGKAALDQAMGGSASAGGSSGGSSGASSNDDKKGGDEKGYGGSGFDPRGLERAAKAAKVCAPVQAQCVSALFLQGAPC